MGGVVGSVSRDTFEWTYTEEPHFSRRKEMLKKYPEIKKLMGHDNNMAMIMVAMVITQVITCYLIQDESWLTVLIVGYCFGGVVNHSMTLALHETGHNLPFGHSKPMRNRMIGFVGNCVIGVPISISFRRYHHDHHRYQGEDQLDPDIPSELEGVLFRNRFSKMIWMILQPGFYAIRPFLNRPKKPCRMEFYNLLFQLVFDIAIVYFMNWKALAYLFFGTVLCMGIHPLAGHFISEHYLYAGNDDETYSYYGPYNYIGFNVGYHVEHHDFPNIPGAKLPLIRKIAPEFYNDLPSHDSFAAVVWDFIMNPKSGPLNRIKRPASKDPTLPDPWSL